MVRAPCCEKLGLRKGAWTAEEDRILKNFVLRHGHGNWRTLPRRAGLARCGKSCRFRWTNYLNPTVKRGNYTKEEEETIINLHAKLGNRWSAIAAKLPGRTDNEIKNVWHTHLKKRSQKSCQSTAEDSKGPSSAGTPPTFTPKNVLTETSQKLCNSNVLDVIQCRDKGSILEGSSGYKSSSQEESDGDLSSDTWFLEENHSCSWDHVYDLSDNIMPEFYDTYWSEGLVIMEPDQHEMPHVQDNIHEDNLWTHETCNNYRGVDI